MTSTMTSPAPQPRNYITESQDRQYQRTRHHICALIYTTNPQPVTTAPTTRPETKHTHTKTETASQQQETISQFY